jgi:regulator of CtrA degradation
MPEAARRLIETSSELYARIKRIDEGVVTEEPAASPARALMGRLERGLGGNLA